MESRHTAVYLVLPIQEPVRPSRSAREHLRNRERTSGSPTRGGSQLDVAKMRTQIHADYSTSTCRSFIWRNRVRAGRRAVLISAPSITSIKPTKKGVKKPLGICFSTPTPGHRASSRVGGGAKILGLGGGAYVSARLGSDTCQLTIAHSVWKTAKRKQRGLDRQGRSSTRCT